MSTSHPWCPWRASSTPRLRRTTSTPPASAYAPSYATIDVPVLVGSFDSLHPAQRLLPLLDKIANDPRIGSMIATVTQEADGNIILIPTIVGHVINFGDTSMVDDKFDRLRRFYRHVSPTRGWEAYDTIAVKWRDRVVATRRDKALAPPPIPTVEETTGELDIDNNEPQPGDSISHSNP